MNFLGLLSIKNILLGLILAAIVGQHFYGTHWKNRAQKAEVQLKHLFEIAAVEGEKHRQKIAELKAQAEDIQKRGWEEIAKTNATFEEYKKNQLQTSQKREGQVNGLKTTISAKERELEALKESLAQSKSQLESSVLQQAITEKEKALLEERLLKQGLECMIVPIPPETLANLNSLV